ncbi:hypothetical protein [Xanthomonas translucens]|uniref:Uncharacterized protein n=1 Tax=Xanthomonas translucens pv. translucens TaxID=134875 RepID=A0ABW9KUS5_XANCT|nr:hypothetical protein [Xanthomonas translucens]MCS3360969.1 hypothetical protein [Xanthomonas translucens pv. translucens]MCS3374813.1 hypothetical protein [Xanthomonas translucens pv. translucens]MCT8275715.1 hypothetical protein [Xanthomonas translucens pv. translucens]MCT8279347.1 hypothetical protein [Xanthomonas translucens pv. translucens]MCT8285493.1 hypothetical protein [Xanthomonas translucens pv. translucens]
MAPYLCVHNAIVNCDRGVAAVRVMGCWITKRMLRATSFNDEHVKLSVISSLKNVIPPLVPWLCAACLRRSRKALVHRRIAQRLPLLQQVNA